MSWDVMRWMTPLPSQATSAPADWINMVVQYGVLGLAAYYLFKYAQAATTREQERADRLEAALAEKNTDLEEALTKVLPALAEVTMAARDMSALLVKYATELAVLQERSRRPDS